MVLVMSLKEEPRWLRFTDFGGFLPEPCSGRTHAQSWADIEGLVLLGV